MGEKSILKNVDFEKIKLHDSLKGDLEILPLRTLDEFLLSSAKFQIPDYKNGQRWWNRVYNNLFYYQTNYFLTAIVIFTYFVFMYTSKILYGMMLTINIIKSLPWIANKRNFTMKEFIGGLIGILIMRFVGFSISYAASAIVLFWISIFTILFFTLIHASLRLRNFSNKVVNFMEGEKRTPMTVLIFKFIDYLGALARTIARRTSPRNQNFTLRNYDTRF